MEKINTGGKPFTILSVLLLAGFFLSSGALAVEKKIPESHPIPLQEKPRCTECHPDDTGVALKPIDTFIHSPDWFKRHMFYASQASHLCNACHRSSFCLDCHANKDELEPADKYSDSIDRWLPHRGDYLYQHRIDARLDPTACFRCHGRQNNRTCKRCHR
jgi:hypothetical protein